MDRDKKILCKGDFYYETVKKSVDGLSAHPGIRQRDRLWK